MADVRHHHPAARKRASRRPTWPAALAAALVAFAVGLVGAAHADEALVERHKAAGTDCAGCHREEPPRAPVATAVCTDCHGAYAAIAARTAKDEPNPHASHQGDLPCETCHHVHKPSVDFCMQCHDFGFKAP